MDTFKLSIIIPTYNRESVLKKLLSSLGCQSVPPTQYEVIVIDDGSACPLTLNPNDYPFALIVRHQANAGPAAARNVGIRLARSPLSLILNDDAIAAPDLLQVHLETHAHRTDKVAVLGQFPLAEHLLTSPFMQALDASDLLFPHRYLTANELHGPGFFWTCNISLPTEALRAVGGFDSQTFRDAICEDLEIGFRLAAIGYKVLYTPQAKCVHEHYITPTAYVKRAKKLGVNTFKLARIHGWDLIGLNTEEQTLEDFCRDQKARYLKLLPNVETLLQEVIRVESEGHDGSLRAINKLVDAVWWLNWTHYLGSMTAALEAMLMAQTQERPALRIA